MDVFFTPERNNKSELKIKNSIFKSKIYNVNTNYDIKRAVSIIKKKYNNATHICYGYRLCEDNLDLFNNPIISDFCTDAGEPSGTAGKPILNSLKHYQLINTLIFVIRYYGGTKLGIPGLIDAYKESSENIIKLTKLKQWKILSKINLEYNYKYQKLVESFIKEYECKIINSNFSDIVTLTIEIDVSMKDIFTSNLEDKSNGTIQFIV